jgi:hypothetical protein
MQKTKRLKRLSGWTGFVIFCLVAIHGLIYQFRNPDMTEMRIFLNNWFIFLPGVGLGLTFFYYGKDDLF